LVCYLFLFIPSRYTDPSTTQIYTLSLHDALPISPVGPQPLVGAVQVCQSQQRRSLRVRRVAQCSVGGHQSGSQGRLPGDLDHRVDRKSTRLNSSHVSISYAVFCLKKKKKTTYAPL